MDLKKSNSTFLPVGTLMRGCRNIDYRIVPSVHQHFAKV